MLTSSASSATSGAALAGAEQSLGHGLGLVVEARGHGEAEDVGVGLGRLVLRLPGGQRREPLDPDALDADQVATELGLDRLTRRQPRPAGAAGASTGGCTCWAREVADVPRIRAVRAMVQRLEVVIVGRGSGGRGNAGSTARPSQTRLLATGRERQPGRHARHEMSRNDRGSPDEARPGRSVPGRIWILGPDRRSFSGKYRTHVPLARHY